ncbi:hypothetical protein ACIBEJ_11300 [Nonomuraea sp. NPDC050790]|uniref:hypothetical protein n=1 Tax=Nonomuraea sp. NPDC050790 TaxID=3364371 RepID=UPI0037AAD43C
MPEKVTYYAIVDAGYPVERPAGMVRRTVHDGGVRDESFQKDLQWHRTAALVEWKRGDYPSELVEIAEDQVAGIIEQFRERWSELR